jgi:two-component system repressor protein LuxO
MAARLLPRRPPVKRRAAPAQPFLYPVGSNFGGEARSPDLGEDATMALQRSLAEPVDVVIVDADPAQRRALAGAITNRGVGRFRAHSCADASEALGMRRDGAIVIADIETLGGTDRLGDIAGPAVSLIATSARGSVNTAVAAVKAGAVDFLPKPIGVAALIDRLDAAVAAWREKLAVPQPAAREPSERPAAVSPRADGGDGFIGDSPAMRAVHEQIRRMAPSRAPVFITGESGTGKEVVAEAIHRAAGRDGRPFVPINCSAIPKDLMESEIFGHVRGAFTGASDNRTGAAEFADGGTLFLDEIGEMDLGLQAKLLRFVQTGTLRRVGGNDLKAVDVRFVCATNRDPFAEVESGRFRSDLFYRLHVLPIHLPPLRERLPDILPLAEAFLSRYAAEEGRGFRGFDESAESALLAYGWPGNVRQLQNAIRRTVVLHDGAKVTAAMLPARLGGCDGAVAAGTDAPAAPVASFRDQERRIIETALAAFRGNVPRAAAALEISPATIYRKMKIWTEAPRI